MDVAFDDGEYRLFTGYVNFGGVAEGLASGASFTLRRKRDGGAATMDWHSGTWLGGRMSGCWWEDGAFMDGTFERSVWGSGTWLGGTFSGSTWMSGSFDGGVFDDSVWEKGTFNGGVFKDSKWFDGEWNGGRWEGSCYACDGWWTRVNHTRWRRHCIEKAGGRGRLL